MAQTERERETYKKCAFILQRLEFLLNLHHRSSGLRLFGRGRIKVRLRRFDTFFFLAPAPIDAGPLRPQPGECERAIWTSASSMLDEIAAGDASAIFPTLRNLERLAQFSCFAEARDHAEAHPVEIISPWIEQRDGNPFLVIPDHLRTKKEESGPRLIIAP